MKKIILIVFIVFAVLVMASSSFFMKQGAATQTAPAASAVATSQPVYSAEPTAEVPAEPSAAPENAAEPQETFTPLEVVEEYIFDIPEDADTIDEIGG